MQLAIESAVLMRQQMFHLSKTLTQTKQEEDTGRNGGDEMNEGKWKKGNKSQMLTHAVQYRQKAGMHFHFLLQISDAVLLC